MTELIEDNVDVMLKHAIERYSEWLSGYVEDEEMIEKWGGADRFFAQEGWTELVSATAANFNRDWDQQLWVVKAYDGDDGGPALLTLWWDAVTEAIYDPPLFIPGAEGLNDPTDDPDAESPEHGRKLNVNAVYVGSKLLGWELRHAVQEFDTYRTMFLSEGLTLQPDGKYGTPDEVGRDEVGSG